MLLDWQSHVAKTKILVCNVHCCTISSGKVFTPTKGMEGNIRKIACLNMLYGSTLSSGVSSRLSSSSSSSSSSTTELNF